MAEPVAAEEVGFLSESGEQLDNSPLSLAVLPLLLGGSNMAYWPVWGVGVARLVRSPCLPSVLAQKEGGVKGGRFLLCLSGVWYSGYVKPFMAHEPSPRQGKG